MASPRTAPTDGALVTYDDSHLAWPGRARKDRQSCFLIPDGREHEAGPGQVSHAGRMPPARPLPMLFGFSLHSHRQDCWCRCCLIRRLVWLKPSCARRFSNAGEFSGVPAARPTIKTLGLAARVMVSARFGLAATVVTYHFRPVRLWEWD